MDKMLNFTFELFKLCSTAATWCQHIESLYLVSKSHLDLRTFRFLLVGSLERHSLLRREQLEGVNKIKNSNPSNDASVTVHRLRSQIAVHILLLL